jgi:hypothetical protein
MTEHPVTAVERGAQHGRATDMRTAQRPNYLTMQMRWIHRVCAQLQRLVS